MHLVTPVSRTNHSARVLHRHTTYLREDAAILVLAEEVYRCETAVAVYVRLHRKEEDFERLCLLRGVKRYPRSDSLAARSRLLKLHAVPYLADLPPRKFSDLFVGGIEEGQPHGGGLRRQEDGRDNNQQQKRKPPTMHPYASFLRCPSQRCSIASSVLPLVSGT